MENKSAKFGMLLFLGTEAMFFAGLISAYLVLRGTGTVWPPPGQPRLPVGITGINTAVLLASAWTIARAYAAVRQDNHRALMTWLLLTVGGGIFFLAVQGYEWMRLLQFGLHATANVYGGTFYVLIGAHAVHVAAALLIIGIVTWRAGHRRYSATDHTGIVLGRMFWTFVSLVWPILYALVYF